MSEYEVETDLIVHCRVKVTVDADNKEDAIDAVAELMPANYALDRAAGWKAKVELKAPKGINVRVVKAYHFEQASGNDKAKRI